MPETLNHYRILGPLGKGGMGEVFVAEDTRLHRKVALKILSKTMAGDPERRERFAREAQAVAALNHPNIVTIHSVEEADGVPFLTMELVEGRPLSELITAGGMPVDALLRIGIAVSDAVGAAHQRGITHRDLKPANIMVTQDGRVKVLDFGLAKLREAHLQADSEDVTRMPTGELTGEGKIIGTVAYMSPEQAEGKPVDQRSDIFSLGVVLHEMATGQRPFKGDTNVSIISSILKDTPEPVSDINTRLPPGVSRIIRRTLSKDPSRRYQTATDLRNDLEDLKQEIDSGITQSMAAPRQAPPSGVSRKWLVAAAVVLALAWIAAGVAYWKSRGGRSDVAPLSIERLTRLTSSGTAFLAALSPDGRYIVHVKNEGGLASLWMRQTATTSDVQIVPPANVRYDGVTYGPDGNYVYYVTYAPTGGIGTLYRVAVLGGTPQRVLEDVDSRITFSPDNTQFAFTRGAPARGTAYLMVANADGNGVRALSELRAPDQFTLNAPSWSPDGKTILAPAQSLRDGPHALVFGVDAETGSTYRVEGRWSFVGDLEWMPDGRSFLAVASEFGATAAQIWQIGYPSAQRQRVTNDLNTYISLSLSEDGNSLATVQVENISNIWIAGRDDIAAGAQITRGRGRGDGVSGVGWLPDGTLYFGSNASGTPQIWASDAEGRNLRQLTTQNDPALAPRGTPDGRHIVFQRFSSGGMHVWRMNADGSDQRQLTSNAFEFSPVPGPDGVVYYTRIESGAPRPWKVPIDGGDPVPLGDQYIRVTDVSADGKELLGIGWHAEQRRSVPVIMPAGGGDLRYVPEVPIFGVAWAPKGSGITFWIPQGGGSRLFRATRDGQSPQALGVIPENVYSYAWSPDGERVAIARGQTVSDVVLITLKAPQE